jgi:hypothetical protein
MSEIRPLMQPWYDTLVQELVRAQTGTREGHLILAAAWREASINLMRISEAHEQLAANVPNSAQAAADLGMAAEKHEVNSLRGVLQGEQQLRERDLQGVLRRLDAIEAVMQRLEAIDAAMQADREDARRQRRLILQALGTMDGGDGHA